VEAMTDQTELHNKLAGEIVASIVKPVIESGGKYTDILVLTESVILGIVLYLSKQGSANIVFDKLAERVRGRIAEQKQKQN
jgi:hypothetical protein